MKLKDIASQLANRINQPHVIEVYLRQVYAKGFVDGTKKSPWISVKDRLPEENEKVLWSEHNIYEADVEYIRKCSPWIGTNERLPNEDEIVLCRMKSNGAIVSGYVFISPDNLPCVSTSPDFEFEDYGGYVLDMWMPIPNFNE